MENNKQNYIEEIYIPNSITIVNFNDVTEIINNETNKNFKLTFYDPALDEFIKISRNTDLLEYFNSLELTNEFEYMVDVEIVDTEISLYMIPIVESS